MIVRLIKTTSFEFCKAFADRILRTVAAIRRTHIYQAHERERLTTNRRQGQITALHEVSHRRLRAVRIQYAGLPHTFLRLAVTVVVPGPMKHLCRNALLEGRVQSLRGRGPAEVIRRSHHHHYGRSIEVRIIDSIFSTPWTSAPLPRNTSPLFMANSCAPSDAFGRHIPLSLALLQSSCLSRSLYFCEVHSSEHAP